MTKECLIELNWIFREALENMMIETKININ